MLSQGGGVQVSFWASELSFHTIFWVELEVRPISIVSLGDIT